VVIVAVVIAVSGAWYRLDPVVSILIGLVIGWRAVRLLRETASVLLESTPLGMASEDIGEAIVAVAGVESVHDLHTWSLSSELHAMSAHVVLVGEPSLAQAEAVCRAVRETLARDFDVAHATLQAEVRHCRPDGHEACVLAPVRPSARRIGR
jgi:cobalt-zinc-cadmium efflux system protein